MIKKTLALLLTACLAVSVASATPAGFDLTVFEESDGFINRVDPAIMVGSITYAPESEQPLGKLTSDNDYVHLVQFDVFLMPNAPAVIRAQFAVAGTLVNAATLTLWVEDTAYAIKVDSHPSTSAYETVTVTFSSPALTMLEQVLEQEIKSLPFRLTGDFELSGEMPVNHDALKALYDLYTQAGGLQQDFTAIDQKYPVEVVPAN